MENANILLKEPAKIDAMMKIGKPSPSDTVIPCSTLPVSTPRLTVVAFNPKNAAAAKDNNVPSNIKVPYLKADVQPKQTASKRSELPTVPQSHHANV